MYSQSAVDPMYLDEEDEEIKDVHVLINVCSKILHNMVTDREYEENIYSHRILLVDEVALAGFDPR